MMKMPYKNCVEQLSQHLHRS